MRILLMSNWFPPVVSGSSFYAESLALALQSRGHKVIGVTLDWGEEYLPEEEPPFPLYRFPVIKISGFSLLYNLKLMGFAFTPGNYKRLKLLIQEHRPDIFHLVNHIFDTNFLATQVSRSLGIPLVGSITTPIQHPSRWVQRILTLLDRMTVGRFGVCRWNGIVSLDQTAHDYVGRVYGPETQRRSRVIPFSVRLDSIRSYQGGTADRNGRPQILMVGHIHAFRNPTQLIRAMKFVLREFPDARLVLAGRLDLKEPLEEARRLGLTRDQVEFRGETGHEETLQLMKTSHLFATWVTGPYPSLGTAPMEAMLCETPVVTDIPEDLFGAGKLKDGNNIVLVNSKDVKAVANTLIRFLKDEALRREIGRRGRQFVLEHLSWERIAEEMEEFYEEILNQRVNHTFPVRNQG